MRTRVRARRSQRAPRHAWAFAHLRGCITDTAGVRGGPVHVVDPCTTSRTCPQCGQCANENRTTHASFVCTSCGFAGLADVIAAGTMRVLGRAAVRRPHSSEADSSVAPEESPGA